MPAHPPAPPVLLFDGVCNFCAGSVQFVIARDPRSVFRFASLQSEAGRRLLIAQGLDPQALDSIVLIQDGIAWRESDAALRVCRRLRAPWCWLWPLHFIPRALRDAAYRFIARHRYQWFGKTEACLLPSPEQRSRFLD